jgi:hypothetical protein
MQGSRLLAYLTLILSVPAFACICVEPPSPSAWYKIHHGQPTFVGVAISVESVSDVVRMGGGKPLLDASGKPIPVTVQKVTFQVEESFDGVKNHAVEVYGSGTTCDYIFTVGSRYLVYGWMGEDRKIRAANCTRTRLSSEAKQDLKFLRSLKK